MKPEVLPLEHASPMISWTTQTFAMITSSDMC